MRLPMKRKIPANKTQREKKSLAAPKRYEGQRQHPLAEPILQTSLDLERRMWKQAIRAISRAEAVTGNRDNIHCFGPYFMRALKGKTAAQNETEVHYLMNCAGAVRNSVEKRIRSGERMAQDGRNVAGETLAQTRAKMWSSSQTRSGLRIKTMTSKCQVLRSHRSISVRACC